eukprot:2849970-Prymnesium_polylepis.1
MWAGQGVAEARNAARGWQADATQRGVRKRTRRSKGRQAVAAQVCAALTWQCRVVAPRPVRLALGARVVDSDRAHLTRADAARRQLRDLGRPASAALGLALDSVDLEAPLVAADAAPHRARRGPVGARAALARRLTLGRLRLPEDRQRHALARRAPFGPARGVRLVTCSHPDHVCGAGVQPRERLARRRAAAVGRVPPRASVVRRVLQLVPGVPAGRPERGIPVRLQAGAAVTDSRRGHRASARHGTWRA